MFFIKKDFLFYNILMGDRALEAEGIPIAYINTMRDSEQPHSLPLSYRILDSER
jgi:hypothetical protein